MSLESGRGLISCSLKQRSRSAETAMFLEPSGEKWSCCVILLFLVAIVRASLIWSALSTGMCAQGHVCVTRACTAAQQPCAHTFEQVADLCPLSTFAFLSGLAWSYTKRELTVWKGANMASLRPSSNWDKQSYRCKARERDGGKSLGYIDGKARFLFLWVCLGP